MNALIIINVQNDSCSGGQLAMVDGDEIVDPINLMMEDFDTVVLTQDWHPSGHSSFASSHSLEIFSAKKMLYGEQFLWSDQCVQGSSGVMIQSRLNTLRADLTIKKGYQAKIDSFSVFFENNKKTSTGLDGSLENALTKMKQAKVNLI